MRENEPATRPDPRAGVPGTIVFDRMAATLERSGRLHRIWALLLAAAGAALLGWGLAGGGPAPLAAGAVALAVALLPWLAARELAERSEGLLVLGEEWAEPGPRDIVARRRAGLIDLVERLYALERRR